MRYMATYDLMETIRNTNQWLGATAQAMGSYPATGLYPFPAFQMLAAWGEVTERAFARMVVKPGWGIDTVVGSDGRDHVVTVEHEVRRPFGDLIRFRVAGRPEKRRRILLIAPMSGHYATLLRSTVQSLLPDSEIWVTDWHNARDIPVSKGKFDIEDYTDYLVDFMGHLGPETNAIAICQPAPLALAATAYLAAERPKAQPRTLTLIGGPIDPDANPTDVTDFGSRVTMGQLEELVIQRVGFKYAGAGRMVYPGLLQLSSFMSMNAEKHPAAVAEADRPDPAGAFLMVAKKLERGEEILHQLRPVEGALHLATLLVGAGIAAERAEAIRPEGEVTGFRDAPHHILDIGIEAAILMDDEHRGKRPRGTGGLCHEARDRAVPLRALVFRRHRLDRGIVGGDLLGEGIVRLELLEDHSTGHAGCGVLAGLGDEVALADLAVHVAVEDLEDALVEVACLPAGGGGGTGDFVHVDVSSVGHYMMAHSTPKQSDMFATPVRR